MKRNWLKWLLLFTPFLFLTIASWFVISYLEQKNLESDMREKQLSVRVAYNTVIDSFQVAAQKDFFYIAQQEDVLKLLKQFKTASEEQQNIIRGRLYRKLSKNYSKMRELGVRQFHFHTISGDSLLRFHMPSKSGDPLLLLRHSIHQAIRELKPTYGFEAGRASAGYRYVFPILDEDELLGSVEFSVSFEALESKLKLANPAMTAQLMMNAENSIDKVFSNQRSVFQESEISPEYFIESPDLSDINKKLNSDPILHKIRLKLAKDSNVASQLNLAQDFSTIVTLDTVGYIVNFIHIENTDSRHAGYVVNYQKFNEYKSIVGQYEFLRWIWLFIFIVIWGLIIKVWTQYQSLDSARKKLKRNNQLLVEAQDLAHFGSWEYDFKKNHVTVSESINHIFGIKDKTIKMNLKQWLYFTHPNDAKRTLKAFMKSVKEHRDFHEEHRIVTRDNTVIYIEHYGRHEFDEEGKPLRTSGTIYDITKKSQEHEKITKILNSMRSIAILTDGKRMTFVNHSFLEFFGVHDLEEFLEQCKCVCERFMKHEYFFSTDLLEEGEFWLEKMLIMSDRSRVVLMADRYEMVHAFAVDINSYDRGAHIIEFSDITETMEDKLELHNKVNRDVLTGAYSRLFFDANIEQIIYDVENKFEHLAVLFLDIDHFKNVNDTYGHDVGDSVLKHFVKTIQATLRSGDFLIRFGGEEFIVLLGCDRLDNAIAAAKKFNKVIERTHFEVVEHITCSIGVAVHKEKEDILQTIKHADSMLYKAKNSGRNQVQAEFS